MSTQRTYTASDEEITKLVDLAATAKRLHEQHEALDRTQWGEANKLAVKITEATTKYDNYYRILIMQAAGAPKLYTPEEHEKANVGVSEQFRQAWERHQELAR